MEQAEGRAGLSYANSDERVRVTDWPIGSSAHAH